MFKHAVDALANAPGGLDTLTLAAYGTPVRELSIPMVDFPHGVVKAPCLRRAPKRTPLARQQHPNRT
jgi:hypothetical protein